MNIRPNPKGFTLIEMVMSLGILLIGILAILALFPVGFDSATRSADLAKATIFAQDRMEEIKRIGYPVAAVATTAFSDPRFRFTVAVAQVGAAADNCQLVTLTVSWDYKRTVHSENFVTIISSLGP